MRLAQNLEKNLKRRRDELSTRIQIGAGIDMDTVQGADLPETLESQRQEYSMLRKSLQALRGKMNGKRLCQIDNDR